MTFGSSRHSSTAQPWVAALLIVPFALACAGPRVNGPTAGEPYRLPWGAVPVESWDRPDGDAFQKTLADSIQRRLVALRAANPSARLPYRVLSLSGGGSRGAYGAGLLIGWTDTGERPEFDVVTGISTGALMATHAFLGSDYDEGLRVYRDVTNDDVYEERSLLAILSNDSVFDTAPLRKLLERTLTPAVIARVAEENGKGRRLFIGTTNLDAQTFVVWDMGAIAASTRRDRLQRYRDVVLASASFPIAFPPVYISVETENGSYEQMHVDGGARETVFFYDFLDEYSDAMRSLGLDDEDVHSEVYLLNNGPIYATGKYKPVKPLSLSVAGATISSLMRKATLGSLYRMWVLALSTGADIHMAYIPPEFPLSENPLNFSREEMLKLFQLGYDKALRGDAWFSQLAPKSQEELTDLINPVSSIDTLENAPWLRGDAVE
jgi:hypothetical protein